jgi:mannose/fructose-specific phosphotransferase system component IIA
MVGVLVISHGNLGACLLDCARHVLGRDPDNIATLAVEKPRTRIRNWSRLLRWWHAWNKAMA